MKTRATLLSFAEVTYFTAYVPSEFVLVGTMEKDRKKKGE
jgi:hypothetical protein